MGKVGFVTDATFLSVSNLCSLKCVGCPIWENADPEAQHRFEITREKQLKHLPPGKGKWLNVVGAEASMASNILSLLSILKDKQYRVRLWSNGHWDDTFTKRITALAQEFFFYLPFPFDEEYRIHTGSSHAQHVQLHLDRLQDAGKKIGFYMPLSNLSLPILPESHDIAKQYDAALFLIYPSLNRFSKDEKNHINYFKKKPKVYVVHPSKGSPENVCPHIPFHGFPTASELQFWKLLDRLPRFR